ncbi:hypothetical protein D3C84_682070 [compost metagenome]
MGVSWVQPTLRHNHTITAAIIERFADHITITRHRQVSQIQTHPGCNARQFKADRRQQHADHVVRSHQGELSSASGRIETCRRINNFPRQSKGFVHLGQELQPQGCWLQTPPDLNQQRIVEMLTQTAKRRTGRRLPQTQTLGGPADAAFAQQGVQGYQQVQVETSIPHTFPIQI